MAPPNLEHESARATPQVAPASPAQQRALRQISLRVVQQVRRSVGCDRSTSAVERLVQAENQRADQALQAALSSGPHEPLACCAGCASCCYQTVDVATVEAIHIADSVRRRPDAAELHRRVAQRVRQRANRGPEVPLACAFLEPDGRCGIYDQRPLVCRGYNSAERADCERNRASGFRAPPARFFKHHSDIAIAIRTTLAMSTRQLGMSPHYVELNAGVLAALDDPQAGQRWLNGEGAFSDAASDAIRTPEPPARKRTRHTSQTAASH